MELALVSAIDRNYVIPYSILLASFRKNNPEMEARGFLMHFDLTEGDLAFIEAAARRYKVRLDFIAIPPYPFLSFATRRHMSPIAFAKAFTSRYVPEDIDRVFLIDADIVVAASMTAVERIVFKEPLAAVTDLPGSTHHHFNSGFVIADLATWRREGVADIAERFLFQYSDALHTHDQHALNLIFKGRWAQLPLEWNWMEAYHRRSDRAGAYTIEEIERARAHPILVHFATKSDKPWRVKCTNPQANLYRRYHREVSDLISRFPVQDPSRGKK